MNEMSQILKSGMKANMYYALDTCIRCLFLNCLQQQVEFLNYSFFDYVEDQMVFSSKSSLQIKSIGREAIESCLCKLLRCIDNKQPDTFALNLGALCIYGGYRHIVCLV
jgi:hypothetical protein